MGAMALTEEVQAQLWRLLRGFVPSLGATGKVSMEKHRLASALRAAASHLEQHHGSYRSACPIERFFVPPFPLVRRPDG